MNREYDPKNGFLVHRVTNIGILEIRISPWPPTSVFQPTVRPPGANSDIVLGRAPRRTCLHAPKPDPSVPHKIQIRDDPIPTFPSLSHHPTTTTTTTQLKMSSKPEARSECPTRAAHGTTHPAASRRVASSRQTENQNRLQFVTACHQREGARP